MLRVKLITIGKIKDRYITDGVKEFVKRLNGYCKFEMIELKEESIDSPEATKKEAQKILDQLEKVDYKIALAIRGDMFSSEELAAKIEKLSVSGVSGVGFVIGSSHGLDKSVYDVVDLKLSFSKMTFPHQMFKLMFVEQLYRSFKIIKKEKYHK